MKIINRETKNFVEYPYDIKTIFKDDYRKVVESLTKELGGDDFIIEAPRHQFEKLQVTFSDDFRASIESMAKQYSESAKQITLADIKDPRTINNEKTDDLKLVSIKINKITVEGIGQIEMNLL